jgi:hypothetical protein
MRGAGEETVQTQTQVASSVAALGRKMDAQAAAAWRTTDEVEQV